MTNQIRKNPTLQRLKLVGMVFVLFLPHSFAGNDNPADANNCHFHRLAGKARALLASPLEFIRNIDASTGWGNLVKTKSPELDATFYHASNEPRRDGSIPLVDPNAKAIVVYFHGSGTQKASGKNFINKGEILIGAGVAPVSIDLPFHGEGPRGEKYQDINEVMKWLDRIVETLRKEKKPIYFVGHSFGPFMAQEYIGRYPDKIKGALHVSAAGDYHPALKWTYENITEPGMKHFTKNEEIVPNEDGGRWASQMYAQKTWHKRPEPKTYQHFLRGADDEWFPQNSWLPAKLGVKQIHEADAVEKWLHEKFPSADISVVDGVGHYIFEHKAKNGENLLMKSIFDMIGIEKGDRYSTSGQAPSARTKISSLHNTNQSFRDWIGDRLRYALRSEQTAEEYLSGWETARRAAWREILEEIPVKAPEFFKHRKVSWERLREELVKQNRSRSLSGWTGDMKQFQADYGRYLEAQLAKTPFEFGRDPLRPSVQINPALVEQPLRISEDKLTHALNLEGLETQLKDRGKIIKTTPISDSFVAVEFEVDGNSFRSIVINGSGEKMGNILDDIGVSASRANQWLPPRQNFTVSLDGVQIKGVFKNGMIQSLSFSN